jgi:hypothetical protein
MLGVHERELLASAEDGYSPRKRRATYKFGIEDLSSSEAGTWPLRLVVFCVAERTNDLMQHSLFVFTAFWIATRLLPRDSEHYIEVDSESFETLGEKRGGKKDMSHAVRASGE